MKRFLLPAVLLLAFLLRILWLDRYPVGFTPDEASFGYDAYSIMKTGKDQWGNTFPLVLKSFGDYKSPLYAYLSIPSIALFGLSKEAIRLPNALIGTLAVLAVYLLAKKLFNEKIGLVAAFLLAISPWHIPMSRGAFEANLTTFFLPFGVWLFFQKRFFLSGLILGLNLFTYHSAKLVTPLVFMGLIFFSREAIRRCWASLLVFAVFAVLTLYTFSLGAGARAKDVNIFNGVLEEASDIRHLSEKAGLNPYIAKIIYNKYTFGLKRFLGNYVSYFSPQFLFASGPAEGTYGMNPGRGVLYWFELPLLFAFIISLIKTKERKFHLFFLFWVLLAAVPAALAAGRGYAANRTVIMLPALPIILALGFAQIPWKKHKAFSYLFAVFSFILFASFLADYFFVSPKKNASAMLFGNYEISALLAKDIGRGKTVVVDRNLSEPHIYIAFANKWEPSDYQKWARDWKLGDGVNWVDQIPEYRLGNYIFKTVHHEDYTDIKDVILVSKKDSQSQPEIIKQ